MSKRHPTHHKKTMKTEFMLILTIPLTVLVMILAINGYVRTTTQESMLSPQDASIMKAECILILGAGVYDNGTPSPMLQDRLLQGISLFKAGASDRIIMSGDHGRNDYDEVNIMKRFAIDQGVPSEKIFMDHAGFSTYESIYRARDIFQTKSILLVTQKYHLYRALYTAKALGVEAHGVASDPRRYAGQEYRELREILARVKDFFKVILEPEPTYLGDVIHLSGNGDQTND